MATKVGAKLTARTGGKFLGPFIGAGVLAWDLWDHHHTRATNMPILRETIGGYCQQMRISLLRDPAGGIMTSIYEIEKGIANSCRTRSTSSST